MKPRYSLLSLGRGWWRYKIHDAENRIVAEAEMLGKRDCEQAAKVALAMIQKRAA